MNGNQINSNQFPQIYQSLEIRVPDLGCVMLNTDKIDLAITDNCLYKSNNPERFWINGVSDIFHLTLLYGLIDPNRLFTEHIKAVLEGWNLQEILIDDVGYFESPYKDEDYYCIVLHVRSTPELLEGHNRLELLPHINTFVGYSPHVTVMYIKKDEKIRDMIIEGLKHWRGQKLKINSITYGDIEVRKTTPSDN